MIDQFCIFERGGTVLWCRTYEAIKGDPVAVLVRSVLLEDRLSQTEMSIENYTLQWTLENQLGLIFVVIFQRQLPPAYTGDLLDLVRDHFVRNEVARTGLINATADFDQFSSSFDRLLNIAERRAADSAPKQSRTAPTRPMKKENRNQISFEKEKKKTGHIVQKSSAGDADTATADDDIINRNREAFLRARGSKKVGSNISSRARSKPGTSDVSTTSAVPRKKIMRTGNKATRIDEAALDFSVGKLTDEADADGQAQKFREQYLDGERNKAFDEILDSDEEENIEGGGEDIDDDNYGSKSFKSSQPSGGLFSYFKGLAGLRSLTRADLKPVMDKFRDELVAKNVAKDIADKLMESVMASLEGKTMESMTSVSTMVRKALEDALTRVLTPRQSTDILAEIAAKKGKGRPYIITFCGVNGVGKSTSLAKTCFYLLNHGHKVMIAACDTFRAGAVEQLRTHVKCLGRGVELFDRGYGKDAAAVAADAIRRAKELQYDVVLVDTAGRMQDNEPLMRALSKLVEVNRPDRLFFVGEALVGNDAVDQLTKFNAALTDHQSSARPRLIDGIVLTKFDTIDDKVGAAVSMVYTTGQPIIFIGIGQTYMDLRKLNTKSLVKALLKL